jgi:hypothetical protein
VDGPILEIQGLSKTYKGGVRALDNVDLEPTGIKLQHGSVGDPRIAFQLVTDHGGVEEQQR